MIKIPNLIQIYLNILKLIIMRNLKKVFESQSPCFQGFLKEDLKKLVTLIKIREDEIAYLRAIERANLTCSHKCHKNILTRLYLSVQERKE